MKLESRHHASIVLVTNNIVPTSKIISYTILFTIYALKTFNYLPTYVESRTNESDTKKLYIMILLLFVECYVSDDAN